MSAGGPAPDVAVIGGGICGTSIAALLAGRGAAVTLYEREAIAAGASGRNSGVVQRPLDPVLVPLYRATLEVYAELAAEAPDAGFALPDEPAGLLLAGRSPENLAPLAASIAATAPDLHPEVLIGPELRAVEPGFAEGIGAVRLPIGFPVVPAHPTYAMATLAERRGVATRLGRDVRPARDGDRVVGVEVDGGIEPAGAVVVAAGPWTPECIDPSGAWRPIRPQWGVVVEVLLADPPHHVVEEAEMSAVGVSTMHEGASMDFSIVPVGQVGAVGSTFLDEEPDLVPWRDRILERATAFMPAIYEAPIREVRACARPVADDRHPLLGPVPWLPGLHVCAGHGPWGISTGPGSAVLVTDAILGGAPPIDPAFDAGRFGAP